MLTQEQLEKLQPLTEDPKFGLLLQHAIETWKIATPIQNDHGFIYGTWKFRDLNNPKCCLLGAALANKNIIDDRFSLIEGIVDYFSFEEKSSQMLVSELIDGFDLRYNPEIKSEAYIFGEKIRKILFGE